MEETRESRRLGSRELAGWIRRLAAEHPDLVVCLNHTDSGSSMYGFCLCTAAELWVVPETHAFHHVEEGVGWVSGPSEWAGQQVVLLRSTVGACPDSELGEEEAALADPRVLRGAALADVLDALPDLPVAMDVGYDPESSAPDYVDWVCSPDDADPILPQFRFAGPRAGEVQSWVVGDEQVEERMVEWPASVDLWNSDICWVSPR